MGLSIYFSGYLKESELLPDLIREVKDVAKVYGWKYRFGYCRRGKIEDRSFDFAPGLAKTNLYEVNLKIKNKYNPFLAVIEVRTLNLTL